MRWTDLRLCFRSVRFTRQFPPPAYDVLKILWYPTLDRKWILSQWAWQNEMTLLFDSATPHLYKWSIDICFFFISVQKLLNILGEILGNLDPCSLRTSKKRRKKATNCVKPRRWAVIRDCATLGSTGMWSREKILKPKSHSRIIYACAWAPPSNQRQEVARLIRSPTLRNMPVLVVWRTGVWLMWTAD